MAFTISDHVIAPLPIGVIDTGITAPVSVSNGSTTTIPTPPLMPGMVVSAFDPTYGMGEFILLKGVANTAVGSAVIYNTTSYTTTLAPTTQNLGQPVAFAMSANTSSSNWAWYQIEGVAVAVKNATAVGNNVAIGISSASAGKVAAATSGRQILGARTANSTVSATTTIGLVINRPHLQGRVT